MGTYKKKVLSALFQVLFDMVYTHKFADAVQSVVYSLPLSAASESDFQWQVWAATSEFRNRVVYEVECNTAAPVLDI